MLEGTALSVNISKEMFRTFGKCHDGFEIDNLGRCIGNRGKCLGQQLQIMHVRLNVVMGSCHIFKWFANCLRIRPVSRLSAGGSGI